MSVRRKRARKRATPSTESLASPSRQKPSALVSAQDALEECVGAICLVEVTLHSLEWQEIASPEHEVLKRALKAIWVVHDLLDELVFKDLEGEGSDREGDS